MLQIGILYADVLEFLMGPIKAVTGRSAQLVLPGDNPDVAGLILEHENGAVSTVSASYASASEYYMLNVYGKDASAYYDLFGGLRTLKRGETRATPRKNNPRSAMAKNMRGPVIMEPFNPLNVETTTTAAMMAAPNPPNNGMCSAAVAAINFDRAISGSGNTYMKPMFTTR